MAPPRTQARRVTLLALQLLFFVVVVCLSIGVSVYRISPFSHATRGGVKPGPRVVLLTYWARRRVEGQGENKLDALGGLEGCDWLAFMRANRCGYAERHGYSCVVETEDLDPKRPLAWGKLVALRRALEPLGPDDWVWLLDADAFITNASVRVEDVLHEALRPWSGGVLAPTSGAVFNVPVEEQPRWRESAGLILPRTELMINTGSMLIRGSAWAKQFVKEWDETPTWWEHPWWEQERLRLILEADPTLFLDQGRVRIVHNRMMDSLPTGNNRPSCWWEPGDFVMHFPGHPDELVSSVARWGPVADPLPQPSQPGGGCIAAAQAATEAAQAANAAPAAA